MKLTTIAAFAALSFTAAAQTPAAKPETPKVEAPVVAPKLDSTARLWRLLANLQGLQSQAKDLQEQLTKAQQALQEEQGRLSGICTAKKGFVLGNADAKSSDAGDLACVAAPDPKPDVKK